VILDGYSDPGTWEAQVKGQLQGFAGGELGALVDEVLGPRKDNPNLRLSSMIITTSIIHQVYTMFGFLGAPTRVINANQWREGLSIHALIEYPNNLNVSLDWHFLLKLNDYREEYAFFGNEDRVMLQFPSPYFRNFPSPVIVQGGEGEMTWEKRIIVSRDEAFRNELLAFYDNIRENKTPISSVNDALQHMRFMQQLIDVLR